MKNFKIRNKVLLPMLVLLAIVTGANVYQLYSLSEVQGMVDEYSGNWYPATVNLATLDAAYTDFRVNQYGAFASVTPEENEVYEKAMKENIAEIRGALKTYEPTISDKEERAMFDGITKGTEETFASARKLEDLNDAGDKQASHDYLEGISQKQYDDTAGKIGALQNFNAAGADRADKKADQVSKVAKVSAFVIMIAVLAFGGLIVFLLVGAIARPIKSITGYMEYLSSGKLDKDVPYKDQKDEVGEMANSVQVFKDSMVKARELEAAEVQERAAKEARQKNIDAATSRFEMSMTDIVKFVSSASTELQASAQSLSASAEETSKQSGAVAAASQQAAANVQTVASASEELTSSINEISAQVSRSSQVASKAVTDARAAGVSVGALVDAAQKIGDVTKMISGIAEQTNLLALNATIEAARAGDAGKGFAVVAAEVKNLANESAKATEEISSQIASIQLISQESADSINAICKIIEEMDEISGSISAAIQEQTAATQEISRNVAEAYTGTSEVTQNIGNVSEAANSTGSASHQVLSAADELSRQSIVLKEEFDTFIKSVAAA